MTDSFIDFLTGLQDRDDAAAKEFFDAATLGPQLYIYIYIYIYI